MTVEQLAYTKIHGKLSKKYKTPPGTIASIRGFGIGKGFTQKQTTGYLIDRMKLPRRKENGSKLRRHSLAATQEFLVFIAKLTPEEWKDINQITEIDVRRHQNGSA